LLSFYPFAVVIGAHNEENLVSPKLYELIDSFDKQRLVVVDENCIDTTLERIKERRQVG